MSDTILDFGAPPVNEVAVGVRFDPLLSLQLPHFGLFWSRVRDVFPACEHASPLATEAGDIPIDTVTGTPIPRIWLISESKNELIQLQSDAFLFNWRQVTPSDPYPRFSHIAKQFNRYFGLWSEFVDTQLGSKLNITSNELTYINAIPKGAGWSEWGKLGELFPDFVWREENRFLPRPDQCIIQLGFPITDGNGRLIVRMNPAKRRTDGLDIVRLELVARRKIGAEVQTVSLEDWLAIGRNWIVRGFADLTNETVQRDIWHREETNA